MSSRTKTHIDNVFAKMDYLGLDDLSSFIKAVDLVKREEERRLVNPYQHNGCQIFLISETRLCKGEGVFLEQKIAAILYSDWWPVYTIYCVCSYLLQIVLKAADEGKNRFLKQAMEQMVVNGIVTRDEGRQAQFPSGNK